MDNILAKMMITKENVKIVIEQSILETTMPFFPSFSSLFLSLFSSLSLSFSHGR
jgi:hypothetical protein